MKRQIVWASQHLEIDTLTGNLKEENQQDEFEPYYEDDMEEKIQHVISTPFGLWRVDDTMNPYKQFKLWMGHTTFTINNKTADIIKHIPGVEVLCILTRYRFMIGVGELFDIRNVRLAIEEALKCGDTDEEVISDESINNQVENLKKKLKEYNQWAIYVFPNGKIDYITDERGSRSFKDKLAIYKKAVDHSYGILIENNNE